MENGKDGEEFVVLSKVRTGCKREFQFALMSQNEIAGSLSRSRVRKAPAIKWNSAAAKKMKKAAEKAVVVVVENEDEPKSDVVDVTSDEENNRCQFVESQRKDNANDNDNDPVVEDERMVGNDRGTGCDERMMNDAVLKNKKGNVKVVPTRLKELLETGLLEGLSVKYIRGFKRAPSDKGLAGIIRGSGIVCFCGDCKGVEVVRPNQFELHAGSSNKRPADYIYLDNGKTLRDVLTACKNVKQDSVVVTILDAISSLTEKNSSFCLHCKEPISEAGVGKTTLLCSSCLIASHTSPIQAIDASERSAEPVSLRKSSSSASKTISSSAKSQGKITRKDLRLHKLVFQDDFLPDGTELGYYVRGKKLLSGYKQGFGIFCYCCETEVSPSQFEAHAGCASRRKPYLNIYTSNGASLHELSLTLSRTCQLSTDENDDLCSICHGPGDLLCCDGCPRSYHIECISLPRVPQNKWYCRYCEDMFQKEKFAERNPNAIAAGRVAGVDPIEQITNRCIRIVKTLSTHDSGGCALCCVQDFCKSGFGPRTVMICDQCEKEYHVGCLREHKMQDLKELPVGDWFCCSSCERINSALMVLIEQGEQKLPDYLVDLVKKKLIEKGFSGDDLDLRWRILSGRKSCLDEIRPLLSKAVSVFHEQFDPIGYGETKQDLIPHMVYGRNLKETEFGGMCCAVLTANSTIVSTAVFRIFGKEFAEVPIVATSKGCEGKGYFQCLYSCLEGFFEDVDVKNILLPAADETKSMWMNRFGFNVMPQEEFDKLRRHYAVMNFDRTSMLQKLVPRSRARVF